MTEEQSLRIGSTIEIPSKEYIPMSEKVWVKVVGFVLLDKTLIRVQYLNGHEELRSDLTNDNVRLIKY